MQILRKESSQLTGASFAKLLFTKLMDFKEKFGYHYMCLSPETILFEPKTQSLHF